MSFNVWAPQGQLAGLTGQSNPNVIHEAGAQVLSGTVFKMWSTLNNGAGGLYYWESLDGLTSWTAHPSNPIGSGTGFNFPTVYHIGSTYYCYSGAETDQIYVRTSSDGITWGSATVAIARGSAGTWDSVDVAQLNILPGGTVGGLYYAYYEGIHTISQEGLATSPDLITWTKGGGNPVLAGGYAPLTSQFINGVYYLWLPDGGVSAAAGALGYNGLVRLSSTNPSGPWTTLSYGGSGNLNRVLVNYPVLQVDVNKVSPQTAILCAIGDPCMISALGNMYIYWTKTDNEVSNQFGISAAIATGITPVQLVSGYEGVVGFPIPGPNPGPGALNLNVLASDTFQRADGTLGANWSYITGATTFQIASHLVEQTTAATGVASVAYWNGVAFPNDQWSQVTLGTNTAAYYGPATRGGGSNRYIGYYHPGAPNTLNINNVAANLTILAGLAVSSTDTLMLVNSGTNLLLYYNGYPILAAGPDSTIASGSAGMYSYAPTAVTDTQISAWSGGGFVAAPTFSPLGSTGNAGSLSLRRRKRRDVIS